MGKEADLLKAVKEKDGVKVQKLLTVPAKKKKKDDSLCWSTVDSGHKIKIELRHINVNVREPKTDYTPLLLAVLHGSKEIAERLIFNCADVTAKDVKGNTGLHLAVFHGRMDVVELMVFNDAEINSQNEDGNTALHIACQAPVDQRVKIIEKLIESGANAWISNKYNHTPLDVAAQYNRVDAVAALMDNVPTLVENRTALIEAALRGNDKTVELLLDYGLDPNRLDDMYGSTALHEAVRFCRLKSTQILLDFQADKNKQSLKKETPHTLASQLVPVMATKMIQLLDDQPNRPPRFPKIRPHKTDALLAMIGDELEETAGPSHLKDYPPLPNDMTWTQNRPLFCSSCTQKNTNLNILDDNLRSLWIIPVLHDAWTILDLKTEHMLTGITIYGWNSPQMLKTFQLQISDSMEGPWTLVSTYTCKSLGSSDFKEDAFPQKFKGFTVRSRFVRLYLVDNHGGSYISFQGIRLHGADSQVLDCLDHCGLARLQDSFVLKGINTWTRLLNITPEETDLLVTESDKRASLWQAVYRGRRQMYPMTRLAWVVPPASSAYVGEPLPEFSIQSDPGVTEVVTLIAQGATILGCIEQRLKPAGDGKPSTATFTNISLEPAGLYKLQVRGITTEIILEANHTLEVRPALRSESEIASAFEEIQELLSNMQAGLDF